MTNVSNAVSQVLGCHVFMKQNSTRKWSLIMKARINAIGVLFKYDDVAGVVSLVMGA